MQIFTPHCTHAHLDGVMLFFTRWKVAIILLAALVVSLMFVPRFLAERFVSQHISLRPLPDLGPHGGTELLLEINTDAVRKEQLQALTDDGRRVLRQARIPFISCVVRGNGVEVQLTRDADVKAAVEKLGELSQPLPGIRLFNVDVMNQRSVDISVNGDLVTLTPSDAANTERIRQAVDQSIEIIRRRVNELGLVEPTIQREDLNHIEVLAPGLQGPPTRVFEILSKAAKLEFRLVDLSVTVEQAIASHPPPDSEILDGQNGEKYLIEKQVLVSGADLVDAQPSFDPRASEPVVSFRFNSRARANSPKPRGRMSASRSPSSSTTRCCPRP